jgi:hypothetical protein
MDGYKEIDTETYNIKAYEKLLNVAKGQSRVKMWACVMPKPYAQLFVPDYNRDKYVDLKFSAPKAKPHKYL